MTEDKNGSRTVDKAIDLLERVAAAPDGVRNLDLARQAGVDKSTSHRLLTTLQQRGLVRRDPQTRKYLLGPRLLDMVTGVPQVSTLLTRSLLYALVDLTGESASFSLLVDRTYVCVDAVQAPHEIMFSLTVGGRYPLNAGATGKAILAFNGPAAERLLDDELPRYAPNTIVDPDALKVQLAVIRSQGYATSDGERVAGGSSIAAPLLGDDGVAFGAVAVSSVSTRLGADALRRHEREIRALATDFSERIVRPHG